jgi:hypothetical protein
VYGVCWHPVLSSSLPLYNHSSGVPHLEEQTCDAALSARTTPAAGVPSWQDCHCSIVAVLAGMTRCTPPPGSAHRLAPWALLALGKPGLMPAMVLALEAGEGGPKPAPGGEDCRQQAQQQAQQQQERLQQGLATILQALAAQRLQLAVQEPRWGGCAVLLCCCCVSKQAGMVHHDVAAGGCGTAATPPTWMQGSCPCMQRPPHCTASGALVRCTAHHSSAGAAPLPMCCSLCEK